MILFLKALYWLLVAIHYFVVVMLLFSLVMCWIKLPIYFAVVVATTVVRIGVSREPCPLTQLENCIAAKIGYTKSTGFIKDWILRPLDKLMEKICG